MGAPVAAATEPGAARRRRVLLLAAVAGAVLVADQVTKSLALSNLADGPVGSGLFRFVLSFNRGAAFGVGQGATSFLLVAGVVLLGVLVYMSRTVTGPLGAVAIGSLLGGSVGNLVDRLFRGFDGAVVDFIDIGAWPVFNVADIGITCGALLLVLSTWERPVRSKPHPKSGAAQPETARPATARSESAQPATAQPMAGPSEVGASEADPPRADSSGSAP